MPSCSEEGRTDITPMLTFSPHQDFLTNPYRATLWGFSTKVMGYNPVLMVDTFGDPAMIRVRRVRPEDQGENFSVIVRLDGGDFVVEQAGNDQNGGLCWSHPSPPLWYILQAEDGALASQLGIWIAEGQLKGLSFMLEVFQAPVSGPPAREVDEFLITHGKLLSGDLVGHQVISGSFVVRRFVPPQESLSYGLPLPGSPELGEDGLRVQRLYSFNPPGDPLPLIPGADTALFGPERWLEISGLNQLNKTEVVELAERRCLIAPTGTQEDYDIAELRDALRVQAQYQVGPNLTTGELGGLWEYLFQDAGLSEPLAQFVLPMVQGLRSEWPKGIPNGTPIPMPSDQTSEVPNGILNLWMRASIFVSNI